MTIKWPNTNSLKDRFLTKMEYGLYCVEFPQSFPVKVYIEWAKFIILTERVGRRSNFYNHYKKLLETVYQDKLLNTEILRRLRQYSIKELKTIVDWC